MSLYLRVKSDILDILQQLQAEGVLPAQLDMAGVDVTPPREESHGDMATNAAMVLAGKASKNPKELAALLAERIKKIPQVTSAEVAGPGFINLRFEPSFWQAEIRTIL